uniref:Uncharacterized protein n=1 Tax=Hyaloperonospora arabidopsidis (strain Emoy2) TaxID=559515 RepID=M4BTR8_HYAAE
MSLTLELVRVKPSYVDDITNAAVLSSIVKPTPEDPLHSVVLKWTQIQMPLHSTNLVKNRDFVYMEATGILEMKDGDRIGNNVLHSIDLPEVPSCHITFAAVVTSCFLSSGPRFVRGNICDRRLRSWRTCADVADDATKQLIIFVLRETHTAER